MSYISLQDDIEDRRFENRAAQTGEYSYNTTPSRPRSATRELPDLTSPDYAIGEVLWFDTGYALVVRLRPRVVMRALTWDALDRLRPWQRFVRGDRIVLPPG
jgi:hypothetical protein